MSHLYQDDFEGLYLRANSFKGTGKFNELKFKEYRSVVQFYASKVYRYNKNLFFKIGLEYDDIESLGNTYLYTFFINNKQVFNDAHHESSVLQRYLRQRFENLTIFTKRKVKGIAETANYENFIYPDRTFDTAELDTMRVLAEDALTAEQVLIGECIKKELKAKFLRYINTVYSTTFSRHKKVLEELKITEAGYKRICMYYIQNTYMKVVDNLYTGTLKHKNIQRIRIQIGNLLNNNKDGRRVERVNRVLNSELDIEL